MLAGFACVVHDRQTAAGRQQDSEGNHRVLIATSIAPKSSTTPHHSRYGPKKAAAGELGA
jgi:hypothetical protein